MFQLKIVTSTVRPGRKGPLITAWISEIAKKHEDFNVEVLDLGVINLPMMNEANHPVLKNMSMNILSNGVLKLQKLMPLFL